MGETIIEKIIRHNTGKAVKPGDIVTVNVDRCMIHDIFIPFVADKFEEMGFTKLHDPDKVVLIYDHLVPASQQDDTRHFHKGDEFVEKYGLTHVHRSDGICHQLMTEAGYVKPGDIAFGTDSHTTTYGCVGAFSSGIGYTEMASILGTGTMWIKVPETIKVVIDGELPENVMSKDIILRLIGDLRADGATYRALEFSGSTIENMSVASRMTMANMAIEAGAKCALFTPDEKTAEYCEIELNDYQKSLVGDEDAVYMKTMTYKAEDFVPVRHPYEQLFPWNTGICLSENLAWRNPVQNTLVSHHVDALNMNTVVKHKSHHLHLVSHLPDRAALGKALRSGFQTGKHVLCFFWTCSLKEKSPGKKFIIHFFSFRCYNNILVCWIIL